MLSNSLTTNEVKNSAGTEVEFSRLSIDTRKTEFAQVGESPSLTHRLSIGHQETGLGIKLRRRSLNRIDKTVMSTVDTSLPVTVSAYAVVDAPVGALLTNAEIANVLAELISFLASTGSDTTIKYDCSGNGAQTLLNGSL